MESIQPILQIDDYAEADARNFRFPKIYFEWPASHSKAAAQVISC